MAITRTRPTGSAPQRAAHKPPSRPRPSRPKARRKPVRREGEWWSQRVPKGGHAMTLQSKVFSGDDPKAMARSLKQSAEARHRRKTQPYRSAMSMLTFYINRAGSKLPKRRLRILERAKGELRSLFHRTREGAAVKAQGTQRKAES